MNSFIVYWHPEPRSFNAALLRTAVETLAGSGHSVNTSDLHAMRFDPVSGRHNFKRVKDPGYFKQQIEGYAKRLRTLADEAPIEVGLY
jgi:NAD(P)H dehydrogenase (quinone)